MNDPKPAKPEGPLWKRIAILALFLCLALPYGLWKLYKDPILSTAAKWRVLVYLCVLPTLLYFTVSIWLTSSSLQKFLP